MVENTKDNQSDIVARADASEGIRQGLEDVKRGRLRPVREFSKSSKRGMVYLVKILSRAERARGNSEMFNVSNPAPRKPRQVP